MKRHNARAIAAAAAAAGVPSHVERKLSGLQSSLQSSLQSVPSAASVKGPVLYVDVVKNMPKEVPAPVEPPPPPLSTPEFSIFREDFPALPGGRPASVTSVTSVSTVSSVPDDWTCMISDDDEIIVTLPPETLNISSSPTEETTEDDLVADEPKSVYSLVSAAEELSLSSEQDEDNFFDYDDASPKTTPTENDSSGSSFDVNGKNTESVPKTASYVHENIAPELLCEVSLIFSKQFIQEGVRQRSVIGSSRELVSDFPRGRCSYLPGFDKSKIRASLGAHYPGLPMGGVSFGREHIGRNSKPTGPILEGAFGLLGLASRLGVAQDGYGNNSIMVYGEAGPISKGTNEADSSFAGPYQGLRCGLNDINFNVPIDRRMASRLGMLQPKVTQMEAELLFYFFYNCPGDMMQMLAAAELADRNWRFHLVECLWLRRQADNPNYAYLGFQESGEYNYFNKFHWKILPRHFNLDPEQIERTLSKEELFAKYGYHPQM